MGDDWRVCTAWGDQGDPISDTALTCELSRCLGYEVEVGWDNRKVFSYAPSAGSADEIAQVAREVLAWHDVGRHRRAPVRTERWIRRDQDWRDVTDEPSAVIDAELQAEHEYRQE